MEQEIKTYADIIESYVKENYKRNFRTPEGKFKHPFLVPGSAYAKELWDWDAWLMGSALLSIDDPEIKDYEEGSVLDFLDAQDEKGRIPIMIRNQPWALFDLSPTYESNIHKPCLASHALAISKHYQDYSWIKPRLGDFEAFLDYYEKNQKDEESGLFYWINDFAIGFDNDPTVFYRPKRSTGAIFLNSLMYQEMLSLSELFLAVGEKEKSETYQKKAEDLKESIQRECFDEATGFFYSADLSLRKVDKNEWLHSGAPRPYHSLPIKIVTWAGMLPLWNGIATQEIADSCVKKYQDRNGLFAPYGIRSVAKNEKTYRIMDSGNPSCWSGPIWINANYFAYQGLKRYGYHDLAIDLAKKTILLLGKDIQVNGDMHEYYDPETGRGIRNKGFQSWNFLVLNLIEDLKKE